MAEFALVTQPLRKGNMKKDLDYITYKTISKYASRMQSGYYTKRKTPLYMVVQEVSDALKDIQNEIVYLDERELEEGA